MDLLSLLFADLSWSTPIIENKSIDNTFIQAVVKGTGRAFRITLLNIRAFGIVIFDRIGNAQKTFGGPISVAQVHRSNYWYLIGLYGIIFFLWNLLPLPLSTFWEVMALQYERVTKR